MTPEQISLMRQAARNLLEHEKVGRKCDPEAVKWAKNVLRWPHEPIKAVNDKENVRVQQEWDQ